MNLLPFAWTISNLLVMTLYAMLTGATASATISAGFSMLDRSKTRRR